MGPSAGDQLLKSDYPGTDPERRRAGRSMAAERLPFLAVSGSHAARSVAKRGTQAAAAGIDPDGHRPQLLGDQPGEDPERKINQRYFETLWRKAGSSF